MSRNADTAAGASAELTFSRSDDALVVRLAGSWRLRDGPPPASAVGAELAAAPEVRRLAFDAGGLSGWDSGLLTFLRRVLADGETRGVEADLGGLPTGVRRLLELASAVPAAARPAETRAPLLARLGRGAITAVRTVPETLTFVGEVALALLRFLGFRSLEEDARQFERRGR